MIASPTSSHQIQKPTSTHTHPLLFSSCCTRRDILLLVPLFVSIPSETLHNYPLSARHLPSYWFHLLSIYTLTSHYCRRKSLAWPHHPLDLWTSVLSYKVNFRMKFLFIARCIWAFICNHSARWTLAKDITWQKSKNTLQLSSWSLNNVWHSWPLLSTPLGFCEHYKLFISFNLLYCFIVFLNFICWVPHLAFSPLWDLNYSCLYFPSKFLCLPNLCFQPNFSFLSSRPWN